MDEQPDPIAAFDQAIRAGFDVARAIFAYYKALADNGFTADQALVLTVAYQTSLLQNASK